MASSIHEQIAAIQLVIQRQEDARNNVLRRHAESPDLVTYDAQRLMANADHTLDVLRDIEALLRRQLHH